mmetsp:Transcript_36102/g.71776  ORF Transcript_36102/g.71776 Transcript_36102/m.71776 type:complete len:132 (+) Transcript_36102:1047-1442(+)
MIVHSNLLRKNLVDKSRKVRGDAALSSPRLRTVKLEMTVRHLFLRMRTMKSTLTTTTRCTLVSTHLNDEDQEQDLPSHELIEDPASTSSPLLHSHTHHAVCDLGPLQTMHTGYSSTASPQITAGICSCMAL